MWMISSRWQQAVRQSHVVVTRADLYPVSGPPIIGLPIVDGTVTIDSTAANRRILTCTISDPTGTLIPESISSPAAPYGAYIRPWRGIQYADGTVELMPLGVFGIQESDVADSGTPGITLTGTDRSRKVQRALFTDPYVIAAGQNYATTIGALADNRLGGIPQTLDTTSEVTPIIVIDAQSDPWAQLQTMADSFGDEVLYDQTGAFILRPQHDPQADQPLLTYASGEDTATLTGADNGDKTTLPAAKVLLDVERVLTDDPGYNGVVMVAESTTLPTPLRTVLFDVDPTSPTYSQGPYGQVPAFQSSPYITSQAGCDAAARAWLKKNLGSTETLTITIVPDPSLDAGDVIRVIRAADNLDFVGVITQITVPLSVADGMDITLVSRTVPVIG